MEALTINELYAALTEARKNGYPASSCTNP